MRVLKTLSKLLFVFVVFAGGVESWLWLEADPLNFFAPTDHEMISIFRDHRAAFERLLQMATEDKILYISGFHLPWERGSVRMQEYRKLISESYSSMNIGADKDGTVGFYFVGGHQWEKSGEWSKGILYFPPKIVVQKEGKLMQSLDNARMFPPGYYLREIEPHWFIYYRRNELD